MPLLLFVPVLFLVTCAYRYLQFLAPSNAVISRARIAQPHPRNALLLGILAACTVVAMHVVADAVTLGAPGWLNLVVLVFAWDAIKFGLAAAFVAHACWSRLCRQASVTLLAPPRETDAGGEPRVAARRCYPPTKTHILPTASDLVRRRIASREVGVPPGDPTKEQDVSETPVDVETPVASPTKKAAAPRKATGAKKTAATTKAAGAKKTTGAKKTAATTKAAGAKKTAGAAPKYPRHTVEQALRIPEAILKQNAGNPTTPLQAVEYAGGTTAAGRWGVEISSAKKYGFLATDGENLTLEDRARKALLPQEPGDRRNALREAILSAPDISDVYNHYRGGTLPDQQFLINALTDRFKIPADNVEEFLTIFMTSIRSADLLDESNGQEILLDVGRETAGKDGTSKTLRAAVKADAGTTCFVMQPFAAPLGSYYEAIFRPAIEQAGLTAVRADAEIFGTGKIIDQIWRGIQQATILVAELTTKNPNVFYELGLAHASMKPVILVSSNEDDVPFDLRHIRTIFYDKDDPFWGQKLTDNLADKIRSAIERPEEAIFAFGD